MSSPIPESVSEDIVDEVVETAMERAIQPTTLRVTVRRDEMRTLFSFVMQFPEPDMIVAMKVNNLTKNLNMPIHRHCDVVLEPVYSNSVAGEAILRRSYVLLMAKAIHELRGDLEEERNWCVEHQLANAYFCLFNDGEAPKEGFLEAVTERMLEISQMCLPITEHKIYGPDAVERFREMGLEYTVELLESLNPYEVDIDICDRFVMLHHRVMIHNTKMLNKFELQPIRNGWALVFGFARFGNDFQPAVMSEAPVLDINHDRNVFVKEVGVECIGSINKLIQKGGPQIEDFISLNNTYQDMTMNVLIRRIRKAKQWQFRQDAARAAALEEGGGEEDADFELPASPAMVHPRDIRLVLIAGPSASGKTTFAKKVMVNLCCSGYRCFMVSVDNYYKTHDECPKDANGKHDFECLEALRVEKFNDDVLALLNGEKVWIPHFSFETGLYNDQGHQMQIPEDAVLICEGIHCLNEAFTYKIPPELKYKIFIAPFTPIKIDDRNYISNKVIRLLRRMIRDYLHRGHSVVKTMSMWPSVRRGEHLHIFPYMNDADFVFNSALDYEISVLKPYAVPLLKTVPFTSPYFDVAREMLIFLRNFDSIPYKFVPRDSLLQEFIGGHWFN